MCEKKFPAAAAAAAEEEEEEEGSGGKKLSISNWFSFPFRI